MLSTMELSCQKSGERLGKPAEGTIVLEAQHRAGMLAITVSDDGRGLAIETIRKKVVEKISCKHR